ncbi:DNA_helicase [Phytophthora megakarya]|uniref:DNA_helicase n=1 Tax=Phytophthora megakarya TaxID=4795 RepID=A0A225WHA5_9STRA|nr:DNA_helicase [Phytophthora megakarya]
MQYCFPALFPDAQGDYSIVDSLEDEICVNLIQRRQFDGLVRSVTVPESCIGLTKALFRVVRGSGLYWSNARNDLMTMMGNRSLATCWRTLFLTLSGADTTWPDFARACNPALTLDECMHLSFVEGRNYLNENPSISARHFHRLFESVFLQYFVWKD